jgi:hypothetical protein
MYYFDFLNLEAYILLNSFTKNNKICLVHEYLNDNDIWCLWIILRDEKQGYVCVSYIWENWYEEEIDFEEKKTNTEEKRESKYKFKDSVPIFKIDYNIYCELKIVVNNHNDVKLKQIFAELYTEKKYED